MASNRDLVDQATAFLRKAGLTWSGRTKAEEPNRQRQFERRMVTTPAVGYSRRRA